MIFVWGAVAWIVVGFVWVKFREEGWLIMITNPRNSRHTWMAIPALFLTLILWPVCNQVARFMFMVSR